MSRKVFTADEVLTAEDVNSFLMDQTVMSFAGTAARGSAIGTAVEGMTSYLEDSDRYESFNGSAWVPVVSTGAWISFTPTFTNFTLGNGTVVARYIQIGKTVNFFCRVTLGSTSSVSGAITLTLPITKSSTMETPIGQCVIEQTGTRYPTIAFMSGSAGTNTVGLLPYMPTSGGSLTLESNLSSSTFPWTWTNGHKFTFQGTYEAA